MGNTIKQLFRGELAPQEQCAKLTPHQEQLQSTLTAYYETLFHSLSKEQRRALEQYEDAVLDMSSESEEAVFTMGFRLGARLMLEVLSR